MTIAILYQSAVFDDIAQLIRKSIKHQTGITVSIVDRVYPSLCKDTTYILLGANDLLLDETPENYVVWQFEQMSSKWFEARYLEILRGAKAVLDYSQYNCEELQSRFGIKAHFVPVLPLGVGVGSGSTRNCNKTIDVLFCGSMNDRRKIIIDKLETKGLKVECRSDLWRHKLTTRIKQARLCLNMHYYPDATLETTRLLTLVNLGATILSEPSTDPVLDEHYSKYVTFADYDQLVDQAIEIVKSAKAAKTRSIKIPQFVFPVELISNSFSEDSEVLTILPEPDNLPFQEADTKNDGSVLVLPVRPEIDDMPKVSIITITRNRPILFQIVKRNVSLLKYPEDRIEWIIVDDSSEQNEELANLRLGKVSIRYYHLPEQQSISYKRNYGVQKATNQIIAHMDDDDYYYPESLYSRVKTLLVYSRDIGCVGVSSYAIYHLIDDYSFKMNTKNISEASMCYYRSFWEKQKFQEDDRGEGYAFLKGRRSRTIVIGYQFCLVAITHGSNATGRLRSLSATARKNHAIFNSWNYATQRFFTKIYKQLIKSGSGPGSS